MGAVQFGSGGAAIRVCLVAVLAGVISACDPAQVDASAVSGGTGAMTPDPGGMPDVPAGRTTTMIGPAGGVAMSSDGRLTLEFPASAVGGMTPIEITVVGAETLSSDFEGINPDVVYELGPDGTEFGEPVVVRLVPTDQPSISANRMAFDVPTIASDSSRGAEPLTNQLSTVSADGTLVASGELSHFSRVFITRTIDVDGVATRLVSASVENLPDDMEPGQLFSITGSLDGGAIRFASGVAGPTMFVGVDNVTGGPAFGTTPLQPDSDTLAGSEHSGTASDYACTSAGEPFSLDIDFFFLIDRPASGLSDAASQYVEALARNAPSFTLNFAAHERQCLGDSQPPDPEPPVGTISRGHRNQPATTQNQGLDRGGYIETEDADEGEDEARRKSSARSRKTTVGGFANFGAGRFGVFASGQGESTVINLLDESVVFQEALSGFTPLGVLAITRSPGGLEQDAAIIPYGIEIDDSNIAGRIFNYRPNTNPFGSPEDGAFRPPVSIEGDFVLDATVVGGGVVGERALLATNRGVENVVFRPSGNRGYGVSSRTLIGPTLSVFQLDVGPALVLQDDVDDGGIIRRLASVGTPETLGMTGPNPRQLRCANGICVASHNGEQGVAPSGITWFGWDGMDGEFPELGSADFGGADPLAGTVGVDITALPNGGTAIIGTGFNNNMVYEVELDADGAFVRQVETPAPTGCEQPGHANWFTDTSGFAYLLTCFGGGIAVDDAHIGTTPAQQ